MIDPEMLPPEQAAELLHRQEALQAEAHTVPAELHLMELLTSIGQVRQLGRSALGVMAWRDIDLTVSAAGMSIDLILETMHPVFAHPNVKRMRYLKEVGHFNPTGEQVHDRHYFGVYYLPSTGVEWKIDISFWLCCGEHPEPVHEALARHLTAEKRLVILWLKDIWWRLPAYRYQVYSVDIYDAVMAHGVQTPPGFDAYVAARGKPTRAEQAQE
ncbi:MAG TPA: hypothetical protein VKB35_12930 [Ktedonobacteraceae bacterium]|nr:hypothetical protein [Ktedonobacteraceae bacterium]